jgi:hypothetical protein
MKTSLAVLFLASSLVAHTGAHAQPAYTPEECKRMRPLMQDQLNKAQDRFAKAKAAARDVAHLATISLSTVAKSAVGIKKFNPVSCTADEERNLA